jgi:hypothetical protein
LIWRAIRRKIRQNVEGHVIAELAFLDKLPSSIILSPAIDNNPLSRTFWKDKKAKGKPRINLREPVVDFRTWGNR